MQFIRHNRPMAGVWRFFNAEEDNTFCPHRIEFLYQSLEVVSLDMLFVAVNKDITQPRAVFLLDAVKFVGLPLLLADFLGR